MLASALDIVDDDVDIAGRRIAVTGASGFIGSHLCAALVRGGAAVVGLDDGLGWRPTMRNLVRKKEFVLLESGSWPYVGLKSFATSLSGCDSLVHLAFRPVPHEPAADSMHTALRCNALGFVELLAHLPPELDHICLISSCMVYGPDGSVPRREDHAVRPTSPYGVAKVTAEQAARVVCSATDTTLTTLRLGTVFGTFETVPRAIPTFIRAALRGEPLEVRGPSDERDYVFVTDIARAIVTALALGTRAAGTFNIATGHGTRTDDLAAMIAESCGTDVRIDISPVCRPPERIVCDTTAAREALGFEPEVSLSDGLSEEIEWFRGWLLHARRSVLTRRHR